MYDHLGLFITLSSSITRWHQMRTNNLIKAWKYAYTIFRLPGSDTQQPLVADNYHYSFKWF